ncbi:MAG TPA: hypothetical protein VHC18_21060 [Amycolatopsis sp.]|nr:hypothetical protein [Amycolatopsis sp.]
MPAPLVVERLGHVSACTHSAGGELNLQQDVFGARVFRQFDDDRAGSRNALALIGSTCVETVTPTAPDGPAARLLRDRGPGWHSLEWTVPSLPDAVTTLHEHGVGVVEQTGTYAVADPRDLHGLPLAVSDRRFDQDDRDLPGWEPAFWSDEHPLGIVGATVYVAVPAPEKAAAGLAALVGREPYAVDRTHLNVAGHGVRFADHAVEFVGSATHAKGDLVGGFLAERGEWIFCLSFTVRDLLAARAFLVGMDVRFEQFGRHTLLLAPATAGGARIELTDVS